MEQPQQGDAYIVQEYRLRARWKDMTQLRVACSQPSTISALRGIVQKPLNPWGRPRGENSSPPGLSGWFSGFCTTPIVPQSTVSAAQLQTVTDLNDIIRRNVESRLHAKSMVISARIQDRRRSRSVVSPKAGHRPQVGPQAFIKRSMPVATLTPLRTPPLLTLDTRVSTIRTCVA